MKKNLKITLILLIIINIYSITYKINASSIWDIGNQFLQQGSSTGGFFSRLSTGITNGLMKTKLSDLIGFLWGIGLLVIFISTIILGIKYMLVLPNEKSRLKQATTPYIIGVVVIFGALTIWRLIINILEG